MSATSENTKSTSKDPDPALSEDNIIAAGKELDEEQESNMVIHGVRVKGQLFHESTDMDPLAHDVMMRAFGKRGLLSFSDTFFDDGNNGDGLWTERVGFSSGRRGLSFHLLQSKSKRSKMWTSRRMMVVDLMSMLASVAIWSLLLGGAAASSPPAAESVLTAMESTEREKLLGTFCTSFEP
ncbi:hypothetical protein AXG93_3545s1320 [Marchantia polymorpha subsp. ruderalis]|uniref:Uncharacterized protein n=1 Tax=Marchantia polymorpha subsp. ruderalis TaxID=1480154 RepID=A0A176VYK5_MARPO|nr:hypothetical protein AXG93_3545s1320 [Marchantia polymorpha subsp. ruderalis]